MRGFFVPASLAVLFAAGCGESTSRNLPAAPSAPSAPAALPPSSPAPPVASSFTIALPIRAADRASNAFGLNSFGIHIGDHGIDGHPGWDIEYLPGANVLAAADGVVQSVLPSEGQEFGIQITHSVNGRAAYRTIYGVRTVAQGVSAGATVRAGEPIGMVASYTRTIGTITVTYGFTHFQLDDFSSNAGLTNQNAVSPERFLNDEARRLFETMWQDAFYPQELVEPFATNPRDVTFPMRRVWSLQSGSLAAQLEVTRANASASDFSYVMRDGAGTATESGRIEIEALAKPSSTLDFIPTGSSQRRRGVYAIVDGTMRIDYGAPGAPRPAGLGGAATYTSER